MNHNYRIYANVSMGTNCRIGDFSSIGMPPRGYEDGELATTLGDCVEIQSHAIICAGNTLGDDFIAGHGLYMRNNNKIGDRVEIGAQSILEWDITIHDNVIIGIDAGIAEYTVIEEGSWLGQQVALASVLHPLCPKAKECGKGAYLQKAVTIGSGAIIYPDLRIGEGSYILPCSVVVGDVRPYSVVSGNPAKEIGDVSTLYPQILERVEKYIYLSENSISKARAGFEAVPTLFSIR